MWNIIRATFAFLVLSACASTPPPRPPANTVVLCPENAPATAAKNCAAQRNAYIARGVSSTVRVRPVAYTAKGGVTTPAGSGVVIGDDIVLTAYHVIADAEYIVVTPRLAEADADGNVRGEEIATVPVIVVRASRARDVAMLKTRHGEKFPISMRIGERPDPQPGQRYWHFGTSSFAMPGTVTEPVTTASGKGFTFPEVVAMKAKSKEGDSGGPVVAPDGTLAGIVLANNETQGLTYFRRIDDVLAALLLDPAL